MSKKAIAVLIAFLIVAGAGLALILIMKKPATAPSSPTSVSTTDATATMSTTGQQAQVSPISTDMVSIQDFAFAPATITVKKVTTVTWTNKDTTKHTVTPDTETADFKSSELLAKNETYRVTFTSTGTFAYHCAPHPNMKGTVIVTD